MQSYIGDRNEVPYGLASAILPNGRKIFAIARASTKNSNGVVVFTSMDGMEWTTNAMITPGIGFAGVVIHPTTGVITAVNSAASSNIVSYTSSDFGATWTTQSIPRPITNTYTNFNVLAYDKFNNRILMTNKSATSASTAYTMILQSTDNGLTWTSAYDKPNNGTTLTCNLLSTDGGPYSIIGRFTNSNTSLSSALVVESGSTAFRETVNPVGMSLLVQGNVIGKMSYNPLSNLYLQSNAYGQNSTQYFFIDPATMATTAVTLPGMQTNEIVGAAVYSDGAKGYIGSTRSQAAGIIVPQNLQRIVRSKYGNGGWLADPAPQFNTSNLEIWMMLDDPTTKLVYTYNVGNIYNGNGIGYIGVTTNLPTPTPTISQSSTPAALDNYDVMGAGSFTSINTIPLTNYALLSNSGVDVKSQAITFSAGSQVNCILPVEGTNDVILFGNFTTVNGLPRISVVRMDKSGTINTEFNFNATGSIGNILSAIIGGDGNVYMTTSSGRVIKMALDGSVDSSWGTTLNISGSPVIHYDARLDRYYITTDARIVRALPDGTVDSAFTQTTIAGSTRAIRTQPDGKVVLFGAFIGVGGSGMQYLARLNADGTRDTTFYYNLNGQPAIAFGGNQMVMLDTGFIIVGSFSAIEGTTQNYIVKINFDGRIDPTFAPVLNSTCSSIVLTHDKKLLITGAFTTVNGTSRLYSARMNQDGTLDTTYTGNFLPAGAVRLLRSMDQPQYSLTPTPTPSVTPTPSQLPLSTVPIAIGSQNLLNVNGITSSITVAVLTNNGSGLVSDPNVAPVTGGTIHGICYTTDGTGDFFAYGSPPVTQDGHTGTRSVVRLTRTGGFVGSFDLNETSLISIILPFTTGNYLFAAAAQRIRKMDGNGVEDTSWGSTLPATVPYAQIAYDSVRGKVYTIASNNTLMCINEDGTLDETYTRTSVGSVSIYALGVQPDGKLVAYASGTSNNIRRFNTNGTTDVTWNVNSNGTANVSYGGNSMAVTKDGIYVVGSFTTINGVSTTSITRLLLSNGAIDPTFIPMTSVTGSLYSVVVGEDSRPIIAGTFTRLRGTTITHVARLLFDGSLDPSFTGISRNPSTGSIYVAKPEPVM